MKKQTAVDFFYWELIQRIDFTPMGKWDVINNILEQAKAMEKEQHFNSYRRGNLFLDDDVLDFEYYFEQYYKYTYGN